MLKPCDKCSCSGKYVDYVGNFSGTTGGAPGNYAAVVDCKYCNGKGWFDEDELVSVPRKYVKDSYFEEN